MSSRKPQKVINPNATLEVGEILLNGKGYRYQIIEKLGTKRRIRFLDTGFEKVCDTKECRNGAIKDWLAPYVCGVGVVGLEIDHPQSHYLYDRWRDMLRRCYEVGSRLYYSYGGDGVTVSDEWKYFPNYVRDVELMDNHENLKIKHGGWQIDKDILKPNNKVYCKEYCSVVRIEDNIRERNDRNGNPAANHRIAVYMFDIYGNFINEFCSMTEAAKHLKSENSVASIIKCCKESYKFHYFKGKMFVYKNDFNSIDEAQKHIFKLIHNSKAQVYKTAIKKSMEVQYEQ